MPLYVADYLADTTHLNTEQHGAYLLLLMACWKRGGELPNDPGMLSAMTKLSPASWRKNAAVLLDFFTIDGGVLVHGRVREEAEKAQRLSDLRRDAGSRGGRPKKPKPEANENQLLSQLQSQTGSQTETPSPSQSGNEPKGSTPDLSEATASSSARARPRAKVSTSEGFERGWKAYPHFQGRSASKAICLEGWRKAAAAVGSEDALVRAVERYAAEDRQHRGECGAPAFERWLKQGRYEAWVDAATPLEAFSASASADPLESWRRRVNAFVNGSRFWNPTDWGPEPGRPGSEVPAHVQREFGFEPARLEGAAA